MTFILFNLLGVLLTRLSFSRFNEPKFTPGEQWILSLVWPYYVYYLAVRILKRRLP